MELIDLGLERSSGLLVEPDDPPKRRRWWPLFAWLPVLLLAAAAPPAEPGMTIAADITLGSGQLADFVGDAIVIVNRELLTVHEVDGTLRWQADVGLSNGAIVQGEGENRVVTAFRGGPNGGRTSAFSLADGTRLWTFAGDVRVLDGMIVVPTAAGLVQWASFTGTNEGSMWLVSPRTGKRLAEYRGWQSVIDFYLGRSESAPIMIRPNYVTEPERTHLAGFNRYGLKIIGSLPRILSNCRQVANLLACHCGAGRLVVMRLYPQRW